VIGISIGHGLQFFGVLGALVSCTNDSASIPCFCAKVCPVVAARFRFGFCPTPVFRPVIAISACYFGFEMEGRNKGVGEPPYGGGHLSISILVGATCLTKFIGD